MERKVLAPEKIAPEALQSITGFHSDVVQTLSQVVANERVVVVGMAQNIFVKKARRTLEKHGIPFEYLEYGSYLSKWKERLAIKLWSGWSTFPQVFVQGVLIGGAKDLDRAVSQDLLANLMTKK